VEQAGAGNKGGPEGLIVPHHKRGVGRHDLAWG